MSIAPALSIIIPCRDDAAALAETLPLIRDGLHAGDQLLVADASSEPAPATVARSFGAEVIACEKPGRGGQLNAGAARASGDVLVFTHADTHLTAAHLHAIRHRMAEHPDVMAGAFFKDTAAHYPALAWANKIERWWMGNFGSVYGDQSVFMRREIFHAIGGFRDIPLMEDIAMSRRLRRAPGFRLIDPPLRTSMRRFMKRGRLLTRLQNIWFILLFRCGVSPERLYRWYYGRTR